MAVLCGYVHIYGRNSLWKSLFFLYWFVQVYRQKTTVNKYVYSLFTNVEKVVTVCNFSYPSVFRCKVLRPSVFYLFGVQSTILLSSSQGENKFI